MAEERTLNRLEHNLLSMQVDDIEPLFILYAETSRDIEGTTLDLVLQALLKLVDMGFSQCLLGVEGKWEPCHKLTLKDLRLRFAGQSEEEQKEYPMHVDEYYFKATDQGKVEEAKAIYDVYYPDD
jgi:hypothetical protein